MSSLARAAVIALLLASASLSAQERDVPALTGRVVDETTTLTAAQRNELEARLQAFEQRKGSQIVLLITGTTHPEPIESFSLRVAEAWKIGRKGVDDGIVIVVAKSDRVMRIEVGYGLEGAVPDAMARRLIEEVFLPGFRGGDFYSGLNNGIDRLIKVIDGEPLPEAERSPGGRGDAQSIETYFVLFMLATFAAGGVLRALLGRLPAALLVGTGMGLLAWLVVAPVLIASLAGIFAFVLTLFGGAGVLGRSAGGGFGGGGFGRGSGGFGGGGGGFGGGGASGRW